MEVIRLRVDTNDRGVEKSHRLDIGRKPDGRIVIWPAVPAIGAWVLFPVLEFADLITVQKKKRDDGRTDILVFRPGNLYGVELHVTERRSGSGAVWAHAWDVQDGQIQGPWLASWHVSKYGNLNETIEGIPWVIAACWAVPAWVWRYNTQELVGIRRRSEPRLVLAHGLDAHAVSPPTG